MAEKIKEGADSFVDTLTHSTERYNQFFDELLVFLRTDRVKRLFAPVGGEGVIAEGKQLATDRVLLRGFRHLRDSLETVPALNITTGETIKKVGRIKQSLLRNTFTMPKDLSRFYKHLRESDGVLFGDLVEQVVRSMYQVQDFRTHSLLSQLVYSQALSKVLFPEIKTQRKTNERLREGRYRSKDEPRNIRVLRMLQEDFDFLCFMQITNDYYRFGLHEIGKDKGMWKMPPNKLGDYFAGKMGKKTNPFYDVPAIRDLRKYVEAILDKNDPEVDKLIASYKDEYLFLEYAARWTGAHWIHLAEVADLFDEENIASLEKLDVPSWESISFSRGVPPSQKIFFPENSEGILMTVDPAPSRAYVATVSVARQRTFKMLEDRIGSAQAARDALNPLSKPFNEEDYSRGIYSAAFYVRRKDGELCVYGDSVGLARAQLGQFYEPCRRLVHHALYNLVHAEYVTGEENEKRITGPDRMVPSPSNQQIPESPGLRTVPPIQTEGEGSEEVFTGRTEHARLLPTGWWPSFRAWEGARKASETIQLHAIIFDDSGKRPVEKIKLELKSDFKSYRDFLLDLKNRYGDRVRFQTYVKESPAEGENIPEEE